MSKLLKVNLKLMLRRKDTMICVIMSAVLALLEVLIGKLNGSLDWYSMFEMPMIMMMFFSAVGGLFISRDYTQNTIRNKLTVGHKRSDIYLANQVAETLFFGVSLIIFFAVSSAANLIVIGTKGAVFSDIMKNMTVCFFAVVAVSALTTFLAMTVKSAAGGVLPIILMYPLLTFAAMAQEFGDSKWIRIFNDIIPLSQMTALAMPDKRAAIHIVYSLILTVFFITAGVVNFRKADLK